MPRPTSWRFLTSETDWFRVQIWKTLGLSQPSRRAEWENRKATRFRRRSSSPSAAAGKESRASLSRMIRAYAAASSALSPETESSHSTAPRRRRWAKYPACTAAGSRSRHSGQPPFSASKVSSKSRRISPSGPA